MTFSRPGRLNRYAIEKSILEKSQGSVKPWEIEQWTLPEVFLFLDSPERPGISEAEAIAEIEAWSRLGPKERLRAFEW